MSELISNHNPHSQNLGRLPQEVDDLLSDTKEFITEYLDEVKKLSPSQIKFLYAALSDNQFVSDKIVRHWFHATFSIMLPWEKVNTLEWMRDYLVNEVFPKDLKRFRNEARKRDGFEGFDDD